MVADACRLWHTVKHLKPVQVWGRAWRLLPSLPIDRGPAPARRHHRGPWVRPPHHRPSLIGPALMRHLNVEHDLSVVGWDGGSIDRLWRYHQHYFEDCVAEGAADRAEWHRHLIARWIAENPVGVGIGWEPYPVSRRIVNWIKMALERRPLPDAALDSLAVQARYLSRHVEWHLLGNHVIANAKGLLFAGLFFEGPEADGWCRMAIQILRRQVGEQVLADGGHFERSPMYHAIVLEDFLDMANLVAVSVASDDAQSLAADLRSRAAFMLRWLAAMTHPDGEIAFFNDAALGVALPYGALRSYASAVGVTDVPLAAAPCTHLESSGYIRVETGPFVAILDVGLVGPDYLPGHAHADTLSWELSVDGLRVLCNSGTSLYGTGQERQRQRGTAAHNTVTVDGLDSSEVWSGFRVGRRARPIDLVVTAEPNAIRVSCDHDGYKRLPGAPIHHRHWSFARDSIAVRDELRCRGLVCSHWHWHPSVTFEPDCDGLALRLPNDRRVRVDVEGAAVLSESSTWHPEFGQSLPTTKTVGAFRGHEATLRLRWGLADCG